jgi:hypothetical protein
MPVAVARRDGRGSETGMMNEFLNWELSLFVFLFLRDTKAKDG